MGKLIDLTGQNFGRLRVICRDNNVDSSKGAYWICECQCGKKKSVKGIYLRNGLTQSCGCLNKEIISRPKEIPDMIGKKFNYLTVKERAKTHITPCGQKKTMWVCVCECGNECVVSGGDLKSGHTKSCGHIPTKQKGRGLIDLIGRRFGRLVVKERADDYLYFIKGKPISAPQWICKCDCGNNVVCQGGNLRSGNTTNCGCSNIISKGEFEVSQFLIRNNIKYLREYTFNDLKNEKGNFLRFDFAIFNKENNLIMVIEYQGEQHFIECGSFGAYQREYSDKIKKDYCKNKGIPLFEIRFDCNLNTTFLELLDEIKMLSN